MNTVGQIQQGRKHDKELRVRQKTRRRNQFGSLLPSFKTIVRNRLQNEAKAPQSVNRKKTLQEILSQPDNDGGLVTSIFSIIPVSASDREQSLTLVINELRAMSDKMNVAITVISFGDDQVDG